MEGRPTEQKMIWKDGIHSNRTVTADGRATGRTDDNTEGWKEGIDAGERLGEGRRSAEQKIIWKDGAGDTSRSS